MTFYDLTIYNDNPLLIRPFTEFWVVSIEYLRRLWHADRGCLLLRTPVPVTLGLAYFLLVETNIFSNLSSLVYKLRRVKDTPNFILSGSKIVKRLRRWQYDPVIIERTIGLVLGPSTALYEPFLKHCTLTNKAVGTIWRALSKPPQRRQGPDICHLWLLVGTPSAIRPELAFSRAEHSRPYSDVAKYIFDI